MEKRFRAWDASEEEMVHHEKLILDPDGWFTGLLLGESMEDVLMASTGCTDFNGVLIYEGDIVTVTPRNMYKKGELDLELCKKYMEKGIVQYFPMTARYLLARLPAYGKVDQWNNVIDLEDKKATHEAYEVIGNIYQNKELTQ